MMKLSLIFTNAAANKAKNLIKYEKNKNLKLRIYITGGGCSGFQYNFKLDDKIYDGDIVIENLGIQLVTDGMSLQYLIGGKVDYIETLEGSKFIFLNPNAKTTCSCGASFSI